MQKNPYLILGLTNEATLEEVETAYRTLRNKYSQLRFEEGEIGANASKMLGELDNAYTDCKDDIRKKDVVNNYGNSYGEIEELIKSKKLEQAQDLLDKCELRDAEWHYMQAQIYYNRQWHSEAKNQLEIACDLDSTNEKYKTTLDRLEKVMNGNGSQQQSQSSSGANTNNQHNQRAGYQNPNSSFERDNSGDACCNACSTLICADCCCECMGGDLIPCC